MSQLDVYNQRLLEKREQQFQELLARRKAEKNKDSTMNPPGISTYPNDAETVTPEFPAEVSQSKFSLFTGVGLL